jgi:MOSC domain-containing protein YiiM
MSPHVLAVHLSPGHHFSKQAAPSITLLAGLGVQGDAHCGALVKHRSRVLRDPTQPNLRQVHLLQSELFEALAGRGHAVRPGDVGENITTRGIDLLALPTDTELQIGPEAVVCITGLRNPCAQIDRFQSGLMAAVLDRTAQGELVRKAGVMAVVLRGGVVAPQDRIQIRLPAGPHAPLRPV